MMGLLHDHGSLIRGHFESCSNVLWVGDVKIIERLLADRSIIKLLTRKWVFYLLVLNNY